MRSPAAGARTSDAQALKIADWWTDSADVMERNLRAMAQQDQVTIASKAPSTSKRAAQYLSGTDGYMIHTLTSAAVPIQVRTGLSFPIPTPAPASLDFD